MSGDSAQGKQAVQAMVKVAVPVANVWAAWTEPARLVEWFPDRVEGEIVVGSVIRLAGDAFGLDQSFEVLELRTHEQLRLRGASPGRLAQLLEVRFKELDDDRTLVRLVHSGFGAGIEARDERHHTASAWQTTMSVLRVYTERYFERPRKTFAVLADAEVAYDDLYAYYTEADHLHRWLTEDGAIVEVGEACDLALRGDFRLTGEVLSRYPARDVAITCREIEGVLVFCALPSTKWGLAGKVGVWVRTWDPANPAIGRLQEVLSEAVDRLVAALAAAQADE